MLSINADIISEIYDSKRLSEEIYSYLISIIEYEIGKKDYLETDDILIKDCVTELMKIRRLE